MFITPSFKKSLIVEQFQGNYLKDPVPKDQARGIIYSIPCKDCDSVNSTSGRPNENLIPGLENTKKRSNKNIPKNLRSANIVYHLAIPSRGNNLRYYVPAQVGQTDAS